MSYKFVSVEEASEALRKGEILIMVDDESRENEGDLVISAEKVTHEALNFMAKEARGLTCVPINSKKALQLDLPRMTPSKDRLDTPFTVSVDASTGGTGISISDRLLTIKTILDDSSKPNTLSRPGHIFPLVAREGGTLERAGHTEGTTDLLEIASLKPVGVICEIMNEDGSMARLPELEKFAEKHSMKIVTIKSIIEYRLKKGKQIKQISKVTLPTRFGEFDLYSYFDVLNKNEYICLVKGNILEKKDVLVRVHSACLTGDVLHSMKCDCGEQLDEAMKLIQKEGGVLLYIPHHEGRGIGLSNKIKAYALQEKGKDTVEANLALGFEEDERDFGVGAQILRDLGLTSIKVLTNNPKKLEGLKAFGLEIKEQIPLKIKSNPYNKAYLETKKTKMHHTL